MKKVDFLPLGSVVVLKGGVKKVVINSRGLVLELKDGKRYFDYSGSPYPEGLFNDTVMYFHHEDIAEVIHEGFKDDDDTRMIDVINNWAEGLDVERGSVEELNAMMNEEIEKANQS